MRFVGIGLVIILFGVGHSRAALSGDVAQSGAAEANVSSLVELDSAFVNGEYEKVELVGLRVLQAEKQLTADERARVKLTVGYALIMLGREGEARDYFSQALDAVPDLTLDPIQVSPKFRVIFDEVKAEKSKEQRVPPSLNRADTGLAGSASISFPARHSLISNLMVPGSGQWREGRRWRGMVFFVAEAVAVGALVWKLDEMRESREKYLSETDVQRIAEAYDRYNRDHRTVWAAGIAAGVVYVLAQVDLIRMEVRYEAGQVQAGLGFRL